MAQAPFDCFAQNGYDIGFCMCFMDPLYCIATYFCPCLVTGWLKGKMDGKSFDILACCCMPVSIYRNRRRVQDLYNHHESEDGTMLAAVCCPCCAITQDAHEYNVRQPGKPATEQPPAATEEPTTN